MNVAFAQGRCLAYTGSGYGRLLVLPQHSRPWWPSLANLSSSMSQLGQTRKYSLGVDVSRFTPADPVCADGLDLAQNGRIISKLEKPAVMPYSDFSSTMARKRETSAYITIEARKSASARLT